MGVRVIWWVFFGYLCGCVGGVFMMWLCDLVVG